MTFPIKSMVPRHFATAILGVLAPALLFAQSARADNPHVVTVMTRNMDAGTDLNYILAATDEASLIAGMGLTYAEIQFSQIPERAARLADEIALHKPDLIALQEVTLWRTAPLLQPPATAVLYDQLELLKLELRKRRLHYEVAAIQSLIDKEAPVPTAGVDLRITDRNVILARMDLPRPQFEVRNAQTHEYQAVFQFGNPVLGELVVPSGWMSVDVEVLKTRFRFVNTHLASTIPVIPETLQIHLAQVDELLAALAPAGIPVVLAGDFNANAESGPEHTGAVERIVSAGWTDCWDAAHPHDPGFTWPLFGEDQASGLPLVPNERIDLVFSRGIFPSWSPRDSFELSAEPTGLLPPYASDHAGVVVSFRLR